MQATVIKTIKETVGGSTLIYQKEFFVHSSPSKFFFGQTRVRRIIFNNTGFISLQMINRPHIRRKPFRTPTTDQRIKFRFITRNQAQHQCNERQQEELSFHNNNSSTPVPGRATNKQKSVGTVLSPVPRLEALVCPHCRNEQRRAYAIMYNTQMATMLEIPTNCHQVHEYTPVDIYRCLAFDCN